MAVKIGGKSGEIIETVKQVPVDPAARALLSKLIDEALGDHDH